MSICSWPHLISDASCCWAAMLLWISSMRRSLGFCRREKAAAQTLRRSDEAWVWEGFSFSFYSHCFLTGYFTDQLTFPSKTFRLVIDELLTICLHVLVDKPEKNMNVLKRHYVTRISLKMYNNIKYNINRLL